MGAIKDQVFDRLQPDTVSGAQDAGNTANDQTKNMLDNMAASAMSRHGLFGAGGINPAPSSPSAYKPSPLVLQGSQKWQFFDADGNLLPGDQITTAAQHGALGEWLTGPNSGFSTVRDTVNNAFNNMQQQYGDH